jgi:hypothetical protein
MNSRQLGKMANAFQRPALRLSVPFAALVLALAGAYVDAAEEKSAPLRLVFWDEEDVTDVAGGKLDFGAEVLQAAGRAEGYPSNVQYGCSVPREDGTSRIYGWRLADWEQREKRAVEVLRSITADGLRFRDTETVFRRVNPEWQGFVNVVYRPPGNGRTGTLFLFSFAAGRLEVYSSGDGTDWTLVSPKAYQDHDACCVIWHAPSQALVNYQHTLQPWPAKRYPDNIGAHRRVMSFRRSTDGVTWESLAPPFLAGGRLWTPDEHDPVDLEFYRPVVFEHAGRYAMLLLDYLAPPPEANSRRRTTRHGPRSAAEWAQSRDGLNWKRGHRELDATSQLSWMPVQGPFARDRTLRFYGPNGEIGELADDRVFFVTSRANCEFSTRPFVMPQTPLALDADARYAPTEDLGRAYIMAELIDENGKTMAGFERQKCLLENVDGRRLPLAWQGADPATLAGRTVRLRFYLREAKIYQVTAGEAGQQEAGS